MRKVVDTNMLQDDDLRAYLAVSRRNRVVVPELVELEIMAAGRDNVIKSTSILAEFPNQVIVAKPADRLAALRGRRKGTKKRFSDGKRTRTLRRWLRDSRPKLVAGRPAEIAHFERMSKHAQARLEEIKQGSETFAADLEEAAKQFTDEELRRIRNKEPFTDEMVGKRLDRVFHFANGFFEALGKPAPPWEDLMHSYIFRFSIAATMHALRWIAVGGAKKAGRDRIRNDIVDASIAAKSLSFDDLLSKDAMAQEIYGASNYLLKNFLAFKPPKKPQPGSLQAA